MNVKPAVAERQKLLTPTIFHEPWWLRIACDGPYQEVTVEAGGQLIARLPYLLSHIPLTGAARLGMPPMTHVLGPALLAEQDSTKSVRSPKQFGIVTALIEQLPKAAHISFRFHAGISNTLAFDAAGFSSGVYFTVEIPPAAPQKIWRQMRDKTRNVIRRASERLSVAELAEAVVFVDFYERNLQQKGQINTYDRATCIRIISACQQRGAGRMLVARDAAGEPQAAIFTIWDERYEYYFMSTRKAGSLNGATSLLIWTALQSAAQHGRIFDMDNVHVQKQRLPNLLLLTGFGGTLMPRYYVRRTSPLLQLGNDAKALFAHLMPKRQG